MEKKEYTLNDMNAATNQEDKTCSINDMNCIEAEEKRAVISII
ncbi:MAG: hypothetical protein ACTTK0_02235 [Stomatobaculum sp.]